VPAALDRHIRGDALMYVAVKGGERAIANAHALLADVRRGDRSTPEITPDQIDQQLALAVDRAMSEGSLYDREIAALAIKQARGDLIEAIFLVRAYRTTMPRFGFAEPFDTGAMTVRRRVSATYKDLPGGQVLGPTFDYTHRLIDFSLNGASDPVPAPTAPAEVAAAMARVTDIIAGDDLIERNAEAEPDAPVADVTRDPTSFPAPRDARLQTLARGDEGFLLGLAYSTQRGYGRTHPFVGEVRFGEVDVEFFVEDLGFAVPLGPIAITECQMVNQFKGADGEPPRFTRGYGLAFGQSERKAMAMALVERALRADEFAEERNSPAQDEEFVLSHADNVQATGFVEHLKLPHYVDFQAELALLRELRREHAAARRDARPEAAE
jgi:alpha-D-ribose 1-methylphosphonate 5-triphosphate synthase subunit PhnI